MKVPCMAMAILIVCATCLAAGEKDERETTVVVKNHDYRAAFDAFDSAHCAEAPPDNRAGKLAWGEAYLMKGYVGMYRATSDTKYLRRLIARFDPILEKRDDKLGRRDDYTSRPMAGWGAGTAYTRNGAKWHMFIVHTGMILDGPSQFVRLVHEDASLKAEFGAKAKDWSRVIEEGVAECEPFWGEEPGGKGGYYKDQALGILPLNQSNALGLVLLNIHAVTGKKLYRDRAEKLAIFMKSKLIREGDTYQWAYWPKPEDMGSNREDISHAAINVEFAVRCNQAGIVFDSRDIALFANTWLKKVSRSDGTWAGSINGMGDSTKYMPGSAGRWLVLCEGLTDPARRKSMYDDVVKVYERLPITYPSHVVGLGNLMLYK